MGEEEDVTVSAIAVATRARCSGIRRNGNDDDHAHPPRAPDTIGQGGRRYHGTRRGAHRRGGGRELSPVPETHDGGAPGRDQRDRRPPGHPGHPPNTDPPHPPPPPS